MIKRAFVPLLAVPLLSGCDAFFDALDRLAAQPRFAFATQYLDEGTDPGTFDDQVVTELFVATIADADPTDPASVPRAVVFDAVRPFEFVPFIDIQRLIWHPDGDHLAVEIYEDIAGFEFDIWVAIYDRNLNQQFLGSDDNLAGDANGFCPTDLFFPPGFEAFVASEISLGAVPAGTQAGVNWGSGVVIAGTLHGWLTPDRFVAAITNDPEVFLSLPDGTITGPFGGPAPVVWGDESELVLVYERSGSSWDLVECLDDLPVIPPRPAPSRVMGIDGAGDVTLDGTVLLGLTGSDAANAPGSTIILDGPYP